jgi:ethanolamine utilization protein EutN
MILGKITGNVVSTVSEPKYESRKILIVQPIDPSGQPKGQSFLAIDTVQAGIGDTVLILEEGGSARMILNEPETFTIKAIIAGIVDQITM